MPDRILCSRHILEQGLFVGVFFCVGPRHCRPPPPLVFASELNKILRFFGE